MCPNRYPRLTARRLTRFRTSPTASAPRRFWVCYLTDYSAEELSACAAAAYSEQNFGPPGPLRCPLFGQDAFLELWHGPTCAFKDMALQIMPRLLSLALGKQNCAEDALILVATSGDTGKAALEGYRDVDRVRILVFYPTGGVSKIQRRQMASPAGRATSEWLRYAAISTTRRPRSSACSPPLRWRGALRNAAASSRPPTL